MSKRRIKQESRSSVEQVQSQLEIRKRNFKRRKRKQLFQRIALLLIVIGFISMVVYVDNQPFSRVQKVEVSGNHFIDSDTIVENSNIKINQRLLFTHSYFIDKTVNAIPGIALSNAKVYYTKGQIILNVKELEAVGYIADGPSVIFADSSIYKTSARNVTDLPIFVGFSEELLKEHLSLTDKLSRIDPTVFSSISEVHVQPNEFETLYLKFVMNNGFIVYSSVENMMLLDHYVEVVTSILEGDNPTNRCIYFLDYYEDMPDTQVTIAKPCE